MLVPEDVLIAFPFLSCLVSITMQKTQFKQMNRNVKAAGECIHAGFHPLLLRTLEACFLGNGLPSSEGGFLQNYAPGLGALAQGNRVA